MSLTLPVSMTDRFYVIPEVGRQGVLTDSTDEPNVTVEEGGVAIVVGSDLILVTNDHRVGVCDNSGNWIATIAVGAPEQLTALLPLAYETAVRLLPTHLRTEK